VHMNDNRQSCPALSPRLGIEIITHSLTPDKSRLGNPVDISPKIAIIRLGNGITLFHTAG
jgi:hypothetical protein